MQGGTSTLALSIQYFRRTIIKEYESKTIYCKVQSIFYAKKRLCHYDRDAYNGAVPLCLSLHYLQDFHSNPFNGGESAYIYLIQHRTLRAHSKNERLKPLSAADGSL